MNQPPAKKSDKPLIGISACLLGANVRYDGGNKLLPFLRDEWSKFFDFVPICPEAECGLPVPREPMNLEGDPDHPRLITLRTRRDLTQTLGEWTENCLDELAQKNLQGFIFKSRSPSCGLDNIPVYAGNPATNPTAEHFRTGLFAAAIRERFPALTLKQSSQLDPDTNPKTFTQLP